MRASDREQHRRERAREDRIFAGRHRAHGVPVIGVVQRDERRAGRLAGLRQYWSAILNAASTAVEPLSE